MTSSWRTGLLWISPWIIGFLWFMLVPMCLSFYYSFCTYPLLGVPVFNGLENYAELVEDKVFWTSVRNTLVFAAITIPLMTVSSIILAVMLNTRVWGRGFFRAVIYLPTLVPVVSAAIIWQWLYNGDVGLINHVFGPVLSLFTPKGQGPPNWLTDSSWAMSAFIFMSLWTIGQSVVITIAALQDVPVTLYEAAYLDGAGVTKRFLHVTCPMISPVILFNVIMALIGTLQYFVQPFIMTEGGPGDATRFYSMYLYDQAFKFRNMGLANSMAWIQLLFVLMLTGLVFWCSRRFVHYER
ncbi:MAG: sugar ABC transporter permease [Phycisphaerales bacterium]|nr:sugar ABC transporter permease [Phycisphaerales bacterium]